MKGPGNAHIEAICHRTGAAIHFPDVARTGATSFFIQGNLDAILAARQHLIGCLPIAIAFELDPVSRLPFHPSVLGRFAFELDPVRLLIPLA